MFCLLALRNIHVTELFLCRRCCRNSAGIQLVLFQEGHFVTNVFGMS